ncbi:hypothetical protein BCR33DRAFT_717598 [Rhizoclosmatium globosum]|uniref:Uncharacterized protein n=1 Tax=Rhizoclosmatium globosum TaxID=329046 RepID=A0A1Y2C8L8_9FUNG|nr:hypothetical protein BCR33DRAFT_717598 [Rhizoclosmatium globosum]|eukprot:ORY43369.1 hypothetical protein BCR33DRAFT_717598 [Rhizoclosmatium globosum]
MSLTSINERRDPPPPRFVGCFSTPNNTVATTTTAVAAPSECWKSCTDTSTALLSLSRATNPQNASLTLQLLCLCWPIARINEFRVNEADCLAPCFSDNTINNLTCGGVSGTDLRWSGYSTAAATIPTDQKSTLPVVIGVLAVALLVIIVATAIWRLCKRRPTKKYVDMDIFDAALKSTMARSETPFRRQTQEFYRSSLQIPLTSTMGGEPSTAMTTPGLGIMSAEVYLHIGNSLRDSFQGRDSISYSGGRPSTAIEVDARPSESRASSSLFMSVFAENEVIEQHV